MKNRRMEKRYMTYYLIILFGLIGLVVCNNKFWRLGKKQTTNKIDNSITYFESGNKIYNVPYEGKWLE